MTQKIMNIKSYKDERGNLSPFDLTLMPFCPKRIYWITNVPCGEIRGCHAHKNTQQLLICLQGEIEIELRYNIDIAGSFQTLKENDCILIREDTWSSQKYLTGKEILLVLCSTSYDKEDYIYEKGY